MEERLYQFAYFSISTFPMKEIDLIEILSKSRTNNQLLGVTGILVFMDGCFLQVLEGEKDIVMALAYKIKADKRHKDFIKLHESEIEERDFKDWSMGFETTSISAYKHLAGFSDLSDEGFLEEIQQKKNSKVIKKLKIFYRSGGGA